MDLDALDHLVLLYAARDALGPEATRAQVTRAAEAFGAAFPDDPLVPMLEAKARRMVVIENLLRQSLMHEPSDRAEV